MSDEIKPGDLVMVVRGCKLCGCSIGLGLIFTAGELSLSTSYTNCCDMETLEKEVLRDGTEDDWFSVDSLIKIDPPSKGDSLPTRVDKEITA